MIADSLSAAELSRVADRLPVAHRLLVELGQAIRDPDVESETVVALLRQDRSLVAKLIRMANSPVYAPSQPVGSLERALACIGFTEVHRLVGVVAAQQFAEQNMHLYPIGGVKLRQNALYVAVIMEELARSSGESSRSCYTIGLLRTIGMMALELIAGPDSAIPPFAATECLAIDEWEQQHWGITNVEVAEKVLLHWRLPHETVSAIRHHYRPENRHNPVAHLLKLAASSAADRFCGVPGEECYLTPTSENFTKAGIRPFDFQQACERAQRSFERLTMASA